MLLAVFLYADDLEYTEDTDHDESILVPVVWGHEVRYLSTEVGHEDEEHEYRHHEHTTVGASPVSKCWVIWTEILGLQHCESSDNDDQEQCEYTRLGHTEYCWLCDFCEALLEHLECREEDDKKSNPLDRWILLEELGNIPRCDHHEDDRDDETDSEIDYIPVARPCDSEDIIQWHGDIGDDDRLDCFREACSALATLFVMLVRADLAVELPYHVEEEYCSEELEAWDPHEENHTEREYDTQHCRTRYSPKYSFFTHLWWQILGRHTDEDGVISTHDEVDEDDIEQSEGTCRGKKMSKVSRERIEHRKVEN